MNHLRFTIRQLLKNPGFSAVAVITLALGVGACTTTFSLFHAVLLKPLPFYEPDRLVWIQNWTHGSFSDQATRMDNFLDWQTHSQTFDEIAGFSPFYATERNVLSGEGPPKRLHGIRVTQNFLKVVGVKLSMGRNFVHEECLPNGPQAAILSHPLWRQQFEEDPDIIGKTTTINGNTVSIVGVLSPAASLELILSPGNPPDILSPLPQSGEILNWGNMVIGVGRLKSSTTINQAQKELETFAAGVLAADPERASFSPQNGPTVVQLDQYIRGNVKGGFTMLIGAVLFVWLIACINLSNLLLARGDGKQHEFALRAALGATRKQLLSQSMTESLVLVTAGCAIGTLATVFGVSLLSKLELFDIPLLHTASVDLPVLAVALLMAFMSALCCGGLPALRLWRQDAQSLAKHSGLRGTSGKESIGFRRYLVITELALACVLLIGAGLLARSFLKVTQLDIGFRTKQVYSWQIDSGREFESPQSRNNYYRELKQRIALVNGVESASLSDTVPFGYKRHWPLDAKGVTYQEGEHRGGYVRFIDDQCLQTVNTPLLRGRYFNHSDRIGSEPVVIISQSLAKNAWKGEDPLGKIALVNNGAEYKVIGIVADVAHGLDGNTPPDFYLSFEQWNQAHWASPNLVFRTTASNRSPLGDVRAAIQEYDTTLPTNEFIHLTDIVDRAIAPRRFMMGTLIAFSVSALLLAAIGLYGLIAYNVGTRTREFGIRIAVGAQKEDVQWMVIRSVMKMSGTGMAIGLLGALTGTRLLQNQLFGVAANDPFTYLTTLTLLGTMTLFAAWFPARRAAMVNPNEALRNE
jgi:putative ABC transport system permease protein